MGQATTRADRRSPVEGARLHVPPSTRAWGALRDPTPREPTGHIHAGVDLGGRPGTPVMAPEAGVVEQVGTLPARPPWTGYPPAVLLRGDSGRWHLLAHLNGNAAGGRATAPLVSVGQRVQLGDVLGYIGPANPADRSEAHDHCHWEVRTRPHVTRGSDPTYTITIDPVAWLAGEEVPIPQEGPHSPPLDPQRGRHRVRRTEQVVDSRGRALSCSSW